MSERSTMGARDRVVVRPLTPHGTAWAGRPVHPAQLTGRLAAVLLTSAAAVRVALARPQARRSLLALDDRTLKDVGLTRETVLYCSRLTKAPDPDWEGEALE